MSETTKGVEGDVEIAKADDEKEEEAPRVSAKATFGRLRREVKNVKWYLYPGMFCGLCSGGCMSLWALFFGFMIEILYSEDVKARAWEILALFLGMGVAFGIFTYLHYFLFLRFVNKISVHLRVQYYKALLKMEYGYFDKESTGAIAGRISSKAKVIEVGLGTQFGQAMESIGMIFGGFAISFYESWLFTLILLALVPVVSVAGGIAGKIISNLSHESKDMYKDASARSHEVLSGIITVQSLCAEAGETQTFKELIRSALPLLNKKATRVGSAMGVLQFINMGFFYGTGMWLGAEQVAIYYDSGYKKGFSAGEVFAAFFGVFLAGFGIGNLSAAVPDIIGGLHACQELYETIDREPKIRKPDRGREPMEMKIRGDITLRNICFSYPTRPDVQVLNRISIDMIAGQTVALVGPSGCGKSTIIALLERFYDPTGGLILIDRVPIWDLDIENYRSQVGYVGQEPVLFNGTIQENILVGTEGKYGVPDVEKAAKQANAHDFIMDFPKKYETFVGEGGALLSGGQKQRISIARALVRNPQILLLDEATSALDTESEKIVQEALDNIISTGGRTCIVIAHRLSTITRADNIIVFSGGKIVQTGSYDKLAQDKKGVFYAMLKAQDVLGVDALRKKRSSVMVRQTSEGRK